MMPVRAARGQPQCLDGDSSHWSRGRKGVGSATRDTITSAGPPRGPTGHGLLGPGREAQEPGLSGHTGPRCPAMAAVAPGCLPGGCDMCSLRPAGGGRPPCLLRRRLKLHHDAEGCLTLEDGNRHLLRKQRVLLVVDALRPRAFASVGTGVDNAR